MCARWADDHAGEVGELDPDMGELINRTADNWRPLFAIADVIGSDWPVRIRETAAALAPRETESIGPMLLVDIKTAFNDRETDRLFSADVCEALVAMEGRPWADWKGKQLTPNQLARLLKAFGVTPENMRAGNKVLKGYHRNRFEAAWDRYVAGDVNNPLQRYNTDELEAFCSFRTATDKKSVADQESQKVSTNGHCSSVAVAESIITESARRCDHCGRSGDLAEVGYGDITAWLHRDCKNGWQTHQDNLATQSYRGHSIDHKGGES
jgi:hypothetical protein